MPHHARAFVLLCGLTLAGCSISILPNDTGTSGGGTTVDGTGQGQSETGISVPASTTSPTTTADPTTTTTGASTGVAATTDDVVSDFLIAPDGGPPGNECDPFVQDCADGQKCTWWANDGGSAWNATKCVPIADDPAQVGEPCVAVGSGVSGEDDCDKGMMCWDTNPDNIGTCVAFCMGSPESPTCPSGFFCAGGRELVLCIKQCDPLAQDCAGDDLCVPINGSYACIFDASGDEGQVNDFCEYISGCDKGLICVSPAAASECNQGANGCCQPMCDLGKPDPCPGAGQTCQPIYEPAPANLEHVGYCTLPQ